MVPSSTTYDRVPLGCSATARHKRWATQCKPHWIFDHGGTGTCDTRTYGHRYGIETPGDVPLSVLTAATVDLVSPIVGSYQSLLIDLPEDAMPLAFDGRVIRDEWNSPPVYLCDPLSLAPEVWYVHVMNAFAFDHPSLTHLSRTYHSPGSYSHLKCLTSPRACMP